jgi:hypothetical protein
VRHVTRVSDDGIIAHITRVVLASTGEAVAPSHDPRQPFAAMAMYVLVRRDGEWWLAAGQNTPIRPAGPLRPRPALRREGNVHEGKCLYFRPVSVRDFGAFVAVRLQ